MRVALLSANARFGDAIGNQMAEKVAFFRDHGAAVTVFLEDAQALHPAVRKFVHPNPETTACPEIVTSADLVITEYSQFFPLLHWLPMLRDGAARVLFDYHGVTPPHVWGPACPPPVREGSWRRGLVWCADAALVHSAFAEGELRDATGFPAEHLHRLGYPVDLTAFAPGPPRRDLRHELRIGAATLLLFVGRLAPNKRPLLLVDALARLRDWAPPVHAVLIGATEDRYAMQADECRRRAKELGVSGRLHLLGHVSAERLRDAYRSADVFVMPSVHEGFCLPVVEALACGLPVVAARAGALPETVGDAGLLFAPDDVTDLAHQLGLALEETAAQKALRQQHARQRYEAFAQDRWRAEFGRIVEDVLHSPRRPRHAEATCLRRALSDAEQCQSLPNDYVDVTTGWGARVKRWLKRKLLGNFKQAYVDVLARQQSEFNRHLLTVVQELTECVAAQRESLERLESQGRLRLSAKPQAAKGDQPAAGSLPSIHGPSSF